MENFLRYGFVALFSVLSVVSFYVSIFQYKTTDKDGKTTYHISRSMGLFIVGLFSVYSVYGLLTGKDIKEYFNVINEHFNNLNRNVTTFTTS